MLTKERLLCFSLTAGTGDHLMQAQWGELCKEHQEPWYFSFFPTLGWANVQNADFINLTSSTKWFQPTWVPAWIPPVRISQSGCSCSYSLCAQICLLRWGKAGRARQDGAINVFLSNLTLYYPAPCSSSRQSVLQRRSCPETVRSFGFFFLTIFFVPIPTLPLQPTLWHVCVFCGVLHFCWLFRE